MSGKPVLRVSSPEFKIPIVESLDMQSLQAALDVASTPRCIVASDDKLSDGTSIDSPSTKASSPGSEKGIFNFCTPANFGTVENGLYRSDFPQRENLGFLATLGLKTIVTLVKKDELDENFVGFMALNNIRHIVIDMPGTKKKAIDEAVMDRVLDLVSDGANKPLLMHCNHGKHRTGCVVGSYRRRSGWDTNDILDEYRLYAGEKVRECDIAYLSGQPFVPPPPKPNKDNEESL